MINNSFISFVIMFNLFATIGAMEKPKLKSDRQRQEVLLLEIPVELLLLILDSVFFNRSIVPELCSMSYAVNQIKYYLSRSLLGISLTCRSFCNHRQSLLGRQPIYWNFYKVLFLRKIACFRRIDGFNHNMNFVDRERIKKLICDCKDQGHQTLEPVQTYGFYPNNVEGWGIGFGLDAALAELLYGVERVTYPHPLGLFILYPDLLETIRRILSLSFNIRHERTILIIIFCCFIIEESDLCSLLKYALENNNRNGMDIILRKLTKTDMRKASFLIKKLKIEKKSGILKKCLPSSSYINKTDCILS